MVNRELIEVFSEIAREKNVERSELAAILEELFLYVIEKEYGDSSNCSCIVNLDKGEIEIYAEKTIVDEIDDYKENCSRYRYRQAEEIICSAQYEENLFLKKLEN